MNHALVEYATPKIVSNYQVECINSIQTTKERQQVIEDASDFIAELNMRFGGMVLGVPWVYGYGSNPELNLNVSVKGFTQESEPKLAGLLEWLCDKYSGFPISYDSPNDATRTYIFKNDEADEGLTKLCIIAQLDEGDGLCKRVVTGTRKEQRAVYVDVDVPNYKFEC